MESPKKQTFYHKSFNAWKHCRRHQDEFGQNFAGILDRFQRDPVYRESKDKIVWTEALCKETDEKSQENHTYKPYERRTCTIQFELGSNTEQFRKQCTIGFSTRFPRSPRPKESPAPAIQKIIKRQFHLKIKIDNEKETYSQIPIVKDLESTRKLGGHIGHLHHLLQHGGRETIGTGKITPHKHGKSSLYSFSRC